MRPSSSDLYDLIHALSPKEISDVRSELDKKTKRSKLFEYLLKESSYDVTSLYKHFKGAFTETNLPPTKNSLRTQILEVLRRRQILDKTSPQILFRQQSDFLEVLIRKGLADQALELALKLKKEAIEESHPFNWQVALSGETTLMQRHYGVKLQQEMQRIHDEMQVLKQHFVYVLDIYSLYFLIMSYTNFFIRKDEDFQKILLLGKHPMFQIQDTSSLSFYQWHSLQEAKVGYYTLTEDFQATFQEASLLWKGVDEKRDFLLKKDPHRYFVCLANYIYSALLAQEPNLAQNGLNQFEKYCPEEDAAFIPHGANWLYYELKISHLKKQPLNKVLEITEAFYSKHGNNLMIHQHLLFNLLASIIYLEARNFTKAVEHCNNVLEATRVNESLSEVQEYAEVLIMIIWFEMGEEGKIALENHVRNYSRKLSGKTSEYPFEILMIEFFKEYLKSSSMPTPDDWGRLHSNLMSLKEDQEVHYFKKVLYYHDVIGWVRMHCS